MNKRLLVLLALLAPAAPLSAQVLRVPEMRSIWQVTADSGLTIHDLSPDGKSVIARYDEEDTVSIHDAASGRKLCSLQTKGLDLPDGAVSYQFSPNGKYVAAFDKVSSGTWVKDKWKSTEKLTLLTWEARSGKFLSSREVSDPLLQEGQLTTNSVTWTTSGLGVLLTTRNDADKNLARFITLSVNDQGLIVSQDNSVTLEKANQFGGAYAFGSNGALIAQADISQLRVWDGQTGHLLHEYAVEGKKTPQNAYGYSYNLTFSPDGRRVLSGCSGYQVSQPGRVWDLETGRNWNLQGGPLERGVFSPDGHGIAGNAVELWDADTGKLLGAVHPPALRYMTNELQDFIRFSPDGSAILSVLGEKLVTYDAGALKKLAGATRNPPAFGEPKVQENDNWKNLDIWGNNYGYQVVRKGTQVSRPGETIHSELAWQIRKSDGALVGTLPIEVYYGDDERVVKAISPGGKILAVVDWEDKTGNALILLWDVIANREMKPLRVPKENVQHMQFSPDGKLLATSSSDARVRVWDVKKARLVFRFPVAKGGVLADVNSGTDSSPSGALAFSPDGKLLATPGMRAGEPIVFWSVVTGKRVGSLSSYDDQGVNSIAFSRDGRFVAGGGSNVRLWDRHADAAVHAPSPYPISSLVPDSWNSVSFVPQGKSPAPGINVHTNQESLTWTLDELVAPWRDQSIRTVRVNQAALPGKETDSTINDVAWSPDGTSVAVSGADATGKRNVRLVLARTGSMMYQFTGESPAGFSLDGKQLFVHGIDTQEMFYSSASGKALPAPPALKLGPEVKLRIDEESYNGVVEDPMHFRLTHLRVATGSKGNGRSFRFWFKIPDWLNAFASSPDGKQIAASDTYSMACIWRFPDSRKIPLQNIGDDGIMDLAFSPDGKKIAGGTSLGFVHVWDAASGQWLDSRSGHVGAINAIAWSPDGKTLATASNDYTIRLWDAHSLKVTRILRGHHGGVEDVEFSPRGNTLASVAADGTLKFWKVP